MVALALSAQFISKQQEEHWEEHNQEMDKFWPSKLIRKNRSGPSKSSLNTVNANKSPCY